ncbi:MAG: SMR family transporter [Pseudomonadota bacterium]
MPWIILLTAASAEIGWVLLLKKAVAAGSVGYGTAAVVVLLVSVGLLGAALRDLPMGTAYAVWTGLGALGIALIGIAFFGESVAPLRLFFLALLIIALTGLKLSTPN